MVNKEDFRMGGDELNSAMEGEDDGPIDHYGNRLDCKGLVFVIMLGWAIFAVLILSGHQAALYYNAKTTPRFNATYLEFKKGVYLDGVGLKKVSTMRDVSGEKCPNELDSLLTWASCTWHKDSYWECATDLPGDYKFSHIYVYCHLKDEHALQHDKLYPTHVYDPTDTFVEYIPDSCYFEYIVAPKDPNLVKWVEAGTMGKRIYSMVGCITSMASVQAEVRAGNIKIDRPSYKMPKCYEAYYKMYRIFNQEMKGKYDPIHPYPKLVLSLLWHIFVAEYNHDHGCTASSIVIDAIETLKHKVVREMGYDLFDVPPKVHYLTYEEYTYAFAVVTNYIEGVDPNLGPGMCIEEYEDDDDKYITPQKQESIELSHDDSEWLEQFDKPDDAMACSGYAESCPDDNEWLAQPDEPGMSMLPVEIIDRCSDDNYCVMTFDDCVEEPQNVICDEDTGACTDGTNIYSPLTRFYYAFRKKVWVFLKSIIPSTLGAVVIGIVLVALWIIVDIIRQLIGVL